MTNDPWRPPSTPISDRDSRQRAYNRQDRVSHMHRSPTRMGRLIAFLVGIALLMVGLSLAFPVGSAADPHFVRALIILVIFGGTAAFWSRSSLWRLARFAGVWILVILGVASFYLYRSDFSGRFMAALDPSAAMTTEEGLLVHRSRDGHFWLRAELNGIPVRMMVDTGASNVVLSPDDAERVGINNGILNFDGRAETANGSVRFARAQVETFGVGSAVLNDVPVTINSAEMRGSLLGLSVLNRFSSFEFRGDTLILRP